VREPHVLSPIAFRRLLEWLDDGVDSHGARYLDIRERLVSYFDCRNRPWPDELADETLNRIARTLEEKGTITLKPHVRYCYVIARFVLLNDLRRREHRHVHLDDLAAPESLLNGLASRHHDPEETLAAGEQRLEYLDRCLEQLKPEQRDLILEYYREERREKIEGRREMATRLGITMNALTIRACRIRSTLEACVGACFETPCHP
jgi:DNA-directed RNA polymerase specialized sigma24 family protein